jgi:GNAT superfamily N-acetyltransferase
LKLKIRKLKHLSSGETRELKQICASCGDFDAYGDDCGFPVLFAELPEQKTAGFLSGCHIPASESVGPETVEVTAAVCPAFRMNGVFKALLRESVNLAGDLYPGASVTGQLPEGLRHSSLAREYLYDELLMELAVPENFQASAVPAGFTHDKCASESGEIHTLYMGSQKAASLTLTRQRGFACVSGVRVPEALRGSGYATMLLSSVIAALVPGTRVVLQVRSDNKPALRVYRKTGFEVSENLSFYRFDNLF